jgi:hypothetical protein
MVPYAPFYPTALRNDLPQDYRADLPEVHEMQATVAVAFKWQHAEPSSLCTQELFNNVTTLK